MNDLLPLLERFAGLRILVVGDVMLDRYLRGEARPDGAITIREETDAPGGAANVAANVRSLAGEAHLAGDIGCDPEGDVLRGLLRPKERRRVSGTHEGRPTTVKTRVMVEGRCVCRFDREWTAPLGGSAERETLLALADRLPADAYVLSDYGKGVCTPAVCRFVIDKARREGNPVVVDTKGSWERFRGATLLKGTVEEIAALAGDRYGKEPIQRTFGCPVVLTRGASGMSMYPLEGPGNAWGAANLPGAVIDPTGAGDTVAAVLALSLAACASLEDACRLANVTAGVVVRKPGTATASAEEVRAALTNLAPTPG